jgi:hypothetical protein
MLLQLATETPWRSLAVIQTRARAVGAYQCKPHHDHHRNAGAPPGVYSRPQAHRDPRGRMPVDAAVPHDG